jgi:hypothetical protein
MHFAGIRLASHNLEVSQRIPYATKEITRAEEHPRYLGAAGCRVLEGPSGLHPVVGGG